MDLYGWILPFLIIFMLHNLEEIITVEGWIKKTYPKVSNRIPSIMRKELDNYKNMTSRKFAIVVFVLSIIISALLWIAVITNLDYLFLGVCLAFAINIFTHPLQALYLRCYTPGVWTSLLLIIPYYILFFYHLSKADVITMPTIIGTLIVIALLIPAFLISHKIGEKWS